MDGTTLLLAALGITPSQPGCQQQQQEQQQAPPSALAKPEPPPCPPNWDDTSPCTAAAGPHFLEPSSSPSDSTAQLRALLGLSTMSESAQIPTVVLSDDKSKKKVAQLFSKLSEDKRERLELDETALYSVTDQRTADELTEIVHKLPGVGLGTLVVDGTACVGGNLLSFASSGHFQSIWGVELDSGRFKMLEHNVKVALGETAQRRVRLMNTDIVSFLKSVPSSLRGSVLFLDPPWGGPQYKQHVNVDLELSGVPVEQICEMAGKECLCRYVILKAPTNYPVGGLVNHVTGRVTVNRSLRKMLLLVVDFG